MDELDKILLQHLPDTGLCERSKAKQAQRRKNLREVLIGWAAYTIHNNFLHGQNGNPANMKGLVTKEGERLNAPDMAMIGGKEGHELAIDEMQFDQQEMEDQKAANKAAQQAWKRSREMRREKYGSDFYEDKTTVRSDGVVMVPFKDECDPIKPKFPSGGTVANPFDKRKNMPPLPPSDRYRDEWGDEWRTQTGRPLNYKDTTE